MLTAHFVSKGVCVCRAMLALAALSTLVACSLAISVAPSTSGILAPYTGEPRECFETAANASFQKSKR